MVVVGAASYVAPFLAVKFFELSSSLSGERVLRGVSLDRGVEGGFDPRGGEGDFSLSGRLLVWSVCLMAAERFFAVRVSVVDPGRETREGEACSWARRGGRRVGGKMMGRRAEARAGERHSVQRMGGEQGSWSVKSLFLHSFPAQFQL